jgi:hypothetical protein
VSKLLFDSNPLVIIPELAVAIGLNESIILQQLHYWLQKSKNYYDGRAWVYNSIPEWCEQFPFLAQRTIERAMASLKSKELVITGNYNKMKADRTLWYSIDYERLESIEEHKKSGLKPHEQTLRQNGGMVAPNWRDDNDKMGSPIPEITTEITTEIKNQSVSPENKRKKTDGQTDDLKELKIIYEKSNIALYGTKLFLQEVIKKMWTNSNVSYQLKMGLTQDDIKDRLRHLNGNHIDNALLKMQGVKSNKELYFMKCLLTSIIESDLDLYITECKEN